MVGARAARAPWLLMAACCALLAPESRASAQASRGSSAGLTIDVPAHLTLGQTHDVLVRYHAPAGIGASLTVSSGTLGPVEQIGDDAWQARYIPPAARYPQIAIFALVSRDGSQYTWTQVALRGSAAVELRSEPNVQVSVTVDGRLFGPVQTDASGRARVPVLVPPGVKQAHSSATDALGNVRTQTISLDVPDLAPLLCVGPPESTRGFLIFVTDANGQPAKDAPPKLRAATVSLTQTVACGPGVYRVGFAVPEQVRPGAVAQLDVSTDMAHAPVSCAIPLALQTAASVAVTLSRGHVDAADEQPVMVRVVPHYAGPGERASTVLELSASLGKLERTRVVTREPVEIAWRLPHFFRGHTRALLRVIGDTKQELSLPLVAGASHALRVRLDRDVLPSDGRTTANLYVEAVDAYGNRAKALLHAEGTGSVAGFRRAAPGLYKAQYRTPLGEAGVDRIVVTDRSTGLHVTRQVTLRDAAGRFALAARAGYLTNFAHVSAPLAIVQLGYRTPWLGDRVRISALVGYYQSTTTVGSTASGDAASSSQPLAIGLWALPLLLRAEYTFAFGALHAGPVVGAGMLGVQSRIASSETGGYLDRHFVPLLAAGANGAVGLGPGHVCAELSYWVASLDKATLTGNAGGMNISVGYEVPL